MLIMRGANEKNAKLCERGSKGVTWPTFQILGPLHISETVEATNFKFGTNIDHPKPLMNKMLSYRRETALQGAL